MDAGAVGQIPWDAFNSNLRESTGWVCRDVGSGSHLMRATLWQVLNVPTIHCPYTVHWLLCWS